MGKISVIDYGCGNLASVVNMIEHVGGEAQIIASPDQLDGVEKLVLPGVGAFDHGMGCLRSGGWVERLNSAVLERRVPTMGICLGMQLMTRGSEEGGQPGLGWIDAYARKFSPTDPKIKVPHMGWSEVEQKKADVLLPRIDEARRYYFVHSYRVECESEQDVLLQGEYGEPFVAGFRKLNVWGFQFHPEKSHKFGMEIFRHFVGV